METATTDNAFLAIAYYMVENMDDYPTLARLSATCKLFKDLVDGRKKIHNQLFDEVEKDLEVGSPGASFIPVCLGDPKCFCNFFHCQHLSLYSSKKFGFGSSAITRYCPDFDKTAWLPCYGCRKFKKTEEFEQDHKELCYDLHSCHSHLRRCKSCWAEGQMAGKEPQDCSVRPIDQVNGMFSNFIRYRHRMGA